MQAHLYARRPEPDRDFVSYGMELDLDGVRNHVPLGTVSGREQGRLALVHANLSRLCSEYPDLKIATDTSSLFPHPSVGVAATDLLRLASESYAQLVGPERIKALGIVDLPRYLARGSQFRDASQRFERKLATDRPS